MFCVGTVVETRHKTCACQNILYDILLFCSNPVDIQTVYLQKRAVTTEIGSAFHEILDLFSSCKSMEEKKRIGSDMTNVQIGYLIRGRFCTAIAWLLLDGMKVQLFGGLVTRDVWKVVGAFVQEG